MAEGYIMESAAETRRLADQQRADPAGDRLRVTGLAADQSALDAGCGPGLITEVMAEIVGPRGFALGLDASRERVGEASSRARARPNLRFVRGDVRRTGLRDASFDYVWSQFVFEYLGDPAPALAEFVRVTRPGGKVVVSDIDGAGLRAWPFPEPVRRGVHTFVEAIAATGFDVHAGRKAYRLFRRAGLADVRVRVFPHYVVAGAADAAMLGDWEVRFAALERVAAPAFGGLDPYRAFCAEYLALLRDEDALKYSVLLVTEGVRP
ncbi:MAG: methyltransferase domain-containing protein [Myxococcota bacterium]